VLVRGREELASRVRENFRAGEPRSRAHDRRESGRARVGDPRRARGGSRAEPVRRPRTAQHFMTGVRVVVATGSGLRRAAMVRLLQDAGVDVAGQTGDAGDLLRKVRDRDGYGTRATRLRAWVRGNRVEVRVLFGASSEGPALRGFCRSWGSRLRGVDRLLAANQRQGRNGSASERSSTPATSGSAFSQRDLHPSDNRTHTRGGVDGNTGACEAGSRSSATRPRGKRPGSG
jgi:hypothetical protein